MKCLNWLEKRICKVHVCMYYGQSNLWKINWYINSLLVIDYENLMDNNLWFTLLGWNKNDFDIEQVS